MSDPYVGEIRLFGFARIPSGWLPCDGRLVSIATNEALFTLLGTNYGGDGETSFGLPDLRGQLPVHQGQGTGLTYRSMGDAGGREQVTVLPSQLPVHSHPLRVTNATATVTKPSGSVQPGTLAGDTMYDTDLTGAQPALAGVGSVSFIGGSQPHDNLMPTLTVSICIASQGYYPPQG